MPPNKIITPTVLALNKESFESWCKELKKYFDTIHVDVVDSSYGDQTWFDEIETFKILKNYRSIVVHLMVENPIIFLRNKKDFLERDKTRYLIRSNSFENEQEIQELINIGFYLGIYFEIGNNIQDKSDKFILFNEFMFLAVVPGKTGQSPDLGVIENLNAFAKTNSDIMLKKILSIDGGLSESTMQTYMHSMANIIYTNSFLKKNGIEEALRKLNTVTDKQIN